MSEGDNSAETQEKKSIVTEIQKDYTKCNV